MDDQRTPFEKYKARRQLLHNCEYQMALLDAQREQLARECRELKANLPAQAADRIAADFPAIIDRVVLENADALNYLSGKEATKDATQP